MLLLQYQGWQQSNDIGIGAGAGQDVRRQQFRLHVARAPGAAQPGEQTLALQADNRAQRQRRAQLLVKFSRACRQAVAPDHAQHGLDQRTGQRPAAKGRPEVAVANFRRDVGGGQQRGAGEAAAEGLGCGEQVRLDTVELARKGRAAAADTGLYFVHDQQSARGPAGVGNCRDEGGIKVVGAGHALHQFDNDGGGLARDFVCHRADTSRGM